MAGNDLGLGIGLSATSNTSRDLYMTGQQRAQRKAMAEYERKKQDDEDFLKLTKDFALKPGYEWHRLLTEEAVANSADKVDRLLKLKASGDPNWRNEVPKLEQEYYSNMAKLVSLNEQYKNFDDATRVAGQGGTYMPSNIYEAWKIFNDSKDRFDLADKMVSKGIKTDPRGYFAYDPEKGDINVLLPTAVDINQEMKKGSDLVPPLLAVSEKVWNGDKSIETTVKKRFKTREEAKAELAAHPTWYPGYSVDNLPPTLEDVRDTLMSDRDFYFQYVDSKGLNNTPKEEIGNILLDELAINSGLKQTQKFGQKNKGLTIINNNGTGGAENKSEPSVVFDGFKAGKVNGSETAKVNYIGAYTPALAKLRGAIPDSVYDAYGNRVNGDNLNNFSQDAQFTGFYVMPYYEKPGGFKVPWTQGTPKTEKLAGFAYFAVLANSNTQSGVWFQPYEKFLTSTNMIPGTGDEVDRILQSAKTLPNFLKKNDAKIRSVAKPTSYDWDSVENYTKRVSDAITK